MIVAGVSIDPVLVMLQSTLCTNFKQSITEKTQHFADVEQDCSLVAVNDSVHADIFETSVEDSINELLPTYNSSRSCDSFVPLFSSKHLLLIIHVYVLYTANRTGLEDILYNIKTTYANVSLENVNIEQVDVRPLPSFENVVCFVRGDFSEGGVVVQKSIFCPLVEIEVDNSETNMSTVILTLSGTNYKIQVPLESVERVTHRHIFPAKYLICVDEYTSAVSALKLSMKASLLSTIYELFTVLLTAMSLFFLIITIITYALFQELRTVPGKNNVMLSVCLFCAQSFLLFNSVFPPQRGTTKCRLLGIFLHFSWLTTFCAMNVCSYHMFHIFSSISKSLEMKDDIFFKYLGYVLAFPCLVIITVVVANVVSSEGRVYGYGDLRCFLDELYSNMFGIVVPLLCIIVLNTVFFLITFYKISKSPNLPSNKQNQQNLIIYVKLCSVTGIAWPFVFIDSMFPLSLFSFFAVFVNALQGLTIFLSFVCNQRVLTLYRQRLCMYKRPEDLLSYSNSTTSITRPFTKKPSDRSVCKTISDDSYIP